ncbi:hypothetical protein FGADI_3359 [Fusarium gaditjirri]|uniref:Uncharacterized protein n=1 Tax=Fusarium gaditjirri TaxID=282569 RepID=A0A8H4X123_9HYPO|nr:hypothetical protein FGADI_3359 [Fusarium gaditjirri]
MLWTQDALPATTQYTDSLALIPNAVICQDALVAYKRTMDSYAAGWKGVFEFVSQPIGPRKLAKTLSLAYSRWIADEEPHATPPPPPAVAHQRSLDTRRLVSIRAIRFLHHRTWTTLAAQGQS